MKHFIVIYCVYVRTYEIELEGIKNQTFCKNENERI